MRRLVRDGIDAPLASLFVHVARAVPPDADRCQPRARSATEAFLFKRLETLPETKDRFGVNATLPIPFNGMASMEVDLLCADARVDGGGLDGAQHLADPIAYRPGQAQGPSCSKSTATWCSDTSPKMSARSWRQHGAGRDPEISQ